MATKPSKENVAKIDERRGKLQQRRGKGERKSAVSGAALGADSTVNVSYWEATFDYYSQNLEVSAFVSGGSGLVDDVTIDAWRVDDGSFLMDAHSFQLNPDVKSLFVSGTRRHTDGQPAQVLSFISGIVTSTSGDPELFSYYRYLDVTQVAAAKKAAGAR